MCWERSLQNRAQLIAIMTLAGSIFLVIIGQLSSILCSYLPWHVNKSGSELDLKHDCNVVVSKGYEFSYNIMVSVLTIFVVLVDIPSSMLLLMGTNMKLKYNLIPWLVVDAFKMFSCIIMICLMVKYSYADTFDSNKSRPVSSYYASKADKGPNPPLDYERQREYFGGGSMIKSDKRYGI